MTDQELRKLSRPELLEMMIRQGRAVSELREQVRQAEQKQAETEAALQTANETLERLKKKLDDKDLELQDQAARLEETIEHLKRRLDAKDQESRQQSDEAEATLDRLKKKLDNKDATIRELRLLLEREREARPITQTKPGSIAEEALRLNHIFEDAQRAADQYLAAIRELAQKKEQENESGNISDQPGTPG